MNELYIHRWARKMEDIAPITNSWSSRYGRKVVPIEECRERQVTSYLRQWTLIRLHGRGVVPVQPHFRTGIWLCWRGPPTHAVWSAESYWRRYDVRNLPVTLFYNLLLYSRASTLYCSLVYRCDWISCMCVFGAIPSSKCEKQGLSLLYILIFCIYFMYT